jgi:hypothetical protein
VNRNSTFKVIGNIKFHVKVGKLPDAANVVKLYDNYVSSFYQKLPKNLYLAHYSRVSMMHSILIKASVMSTILETGSDMDYSLRD